MLYNGYYASPLGTISLVSNEVSLLKLTFVNDIPGESITSPIIDETKRQLELYFSKQLQKFELPVALTLSGFQKRVLEEVLKVPYGHTVTYLQLAHRLGSTRLTRAVAGANAVNPLLLVIPCHRIVGKHNKMTGYAGEIWRKEWLLKHEDALLQGVF